MDELDPRALARRPVTSGLALLALLASVLAWQYEAVGTLATSADTLPLEPWRLWTSALPHVDILHLVFNLYWLVIVFGALEEPLGHARTLLLVLVTQVCAAGLQHGLDAGGVGLSGVGYGFMAFAWAARGAGPVFAQVGSASNARLFAIWGIFCVVTTLTGAYAVANVAHAGGALAGYLAGRAYVAGAGARAGWASALVAVALTSLVVAVPQVRQRINMSSAIAEELSEAGRERFAAADYDEALRLFDQAAARRPEGAWLHYNRCVTLMQLGRIDDALAACDEALRLAPGEAEYRTTQLHLRQQQALRALQDDPMGALAALQALLDEEASAEDWRPTASRLVLRAYELAEREPETSLALVRFASERVPDDADYHARTARAHARLEQYREAEVHMRHARRLAPTEVTHRRMIAYYLRMQASQLLAALDGEAALRALDEAQRVDEALEHDASFWSQRAAAHEASGDLEAAERDRDRGRDAGVER